MQETRETQVQSLGQEDPLEEGMAIHSSILVWRIPRTVGPSRLWSIGSHRVGHDWSDLAHTLSTTASFAGCKHRGWGHTGLYCVGIICWYIATLLGQAIKWTRVNCQKIKSSLTKSFIFIFLRNLHVVFYSAYAILRVSLVAQVVKNLYAMQETQVQSLGQEGPMKKGMAIHSSILAWESQGQRSLVNYSPWGRKESCHFTLFSR